MPRASRARPASRRPKPRRTPPPPSTPTSEPVPPSWTGPPTGHAVCRNCGRILRLELVPGDAANLEAFADRRPPGWSAETITLTVTGVCSDCRAGAPARR